jgi:P-type Cu+ transporter
MYVKESPDSLSANVRGTTYFFCSESCMREFLSPEREFRELRFMTGASFVLLVPILLLTYVTGILGGDSGYALILLDTPVQFILGWRFYRGTYDAIKSEMGNMDVLIALGTTTAWAYSVASVLLPGISTDHAVFFDSAAVIVTLALTGRLLEHAMRNRASGAVRSLLEMRPQIAHLATKEGETDVAVEKVSVGEVVVVRPGERIPVDGLVTDGKSDVDESMITGESSPVAKQPGSSTIGGTINVTGPLRVRTEQVGQDSVLSQIAHYVEQAQAGRAPVQRTADRIAAYFVPLVVIVALGSFLYWYEIGHIPVDLALLAFVSVVVIACPCALGVATPAALLVGTSVAARDGILIKGGAEMEAAAKVDTVVFDKTGTLTIGQPAVTDVIPLSPYSPDEIVSLGASAESGSEHPLGRALVAQAIRLHLQTLPSEEFRYTPGTGVTARVRGKLVSIGSADEPTRQIYDAAQPGRTIESMEGDGKTVLVVLVDGAVAGLVALSDQLKPSARTAIRRLREMGFRLTMLTGDSPRTAARVAEQAGLDEFRGAVKPQQKAEQLVEMRNAGRKVAMVGDGINDAPALASAEVGIAIGSGSDIAKETGGIVLIGDDLSNVVEAIRISRATLSKIRQNLFWAFMYNVALIPLAAGLLVPFFGEHVYEVLPFLAAAAMAVSSATVIANSLLLSRFRPLAPEQVVVPSGHLSAR